MTLTAAKPKTIKPMIFSTTKGIQKVKK